MITSLQCFKDSRGSLFPLEFKDLTFEPKRCFIVDGTPKGTRRGDHAHFNTEQYLICLKGEIDVGIINEYGETVTTIKSMEGILIPKMSWDYQIFKTGDDMLLVLASTEFDRKDYINDLNYFKKVCAK